ncbi:MFS transporter [Seohaeicola nanhaiensis]|uniref:MFS transporter n=1 Tax=Seohaeicola nanhaiensis TaxID=1387282 RepID=A0ABV9KBG0_9RHOB
MQARYLVVAGACLTQFTVIGLLFSFGLFFKVFETEFGWSRTLFSACSSLAFFMMGLLAMVGGRLTDSFGPRRVLAATGLAYGLGYALMSQVSAPWQMFAIFGTLIGLGLGTHDVVTLSTVAHWFGERRGLMTAVVKVGTALGQMVLPLIVALLIAGVGWRVTVIAMGALAAIVLFGAAQAMSLPPVARETPGATQVDQPVAGNRRTLLILCAIQACFVPTLLTVPLHLPAHGADLGLSVPGSAGLVSIVGGASVAGRLVLGRALDAIGGRNAYLICLAGMVVALAGLAGFRNLALLYPTIALYGFCHGALFVVVSPTVAEYFGLSGHGAKFGRVLFAGSSLAWLGPILAGTLFDTTGSYFWAFIALLVLTLLAFALTLSLPRRRHA